MLTHNCSCICVQVGSLSYLFFLSFFHSFLFFSLNPILPFQSDLWKSTIIFWSSYFAKRLIYEENPEVLGKDEYKKIHRAIAGQILSTNDEKWNTVPKAFKDIDDLRVKYDELMDEKTLGMLSDLSEYIEEIQTKYESA